MKYQKMKKGIRQWRCRLIAFFLLFAMVAVLPGTSALAQGMKEATPLSISLSPSTLTVKEGETGYIYAKASGGNSASYSYWWYLAASRTGEGVQITKISSDATGISVTGDLELDGYYIYCELCDGTNRVQSNRTLIRVTGENTTPLTVSLSPSTLTLKEGEKGDINATVSGGASSSYTYKWYLAASAGGTGEWLSHLSSDGITVTGEKSLNGCYVYCEVSDGTSTARSNRTLIRVEAGAASQEAAQKITYKTSKITNGKIVYGTKPFSLKAKTNGGGRLSYKSSNENVVKVSAAGKVTVVGYGSATISIKAAPVQGYRQASKKIKIQVVPKKAEITNGYFASKGKAVFEWKNDKSVSGFQFSYANNKGFKNDKKVNTKKRTRVTISLGAGNYYVRVRAYKKVNGKTYYGNWGKVWNIEV